MKAELLAVLYGLRSLRPDTGRNVVIETDSMGVCDLLNNNLPVTHSEFYIANECQSLLNKDGWIFNLRHIPRKNNEVADILANLVASGV